MGTRSAAISAWWGGGRDRPGKRAPAGPAIRLFPLLPHKAFFFVLFGPTKSTRPPSPPPPLSLSPPAPFSPPVPPLMDSTVEFSSVRAAEMPAMAACRRRREAREALGSALPAAAGVPAAPSPLPPSESGAGRGRHTARGGAILACHSAIYAYHGCGEAAGCGRGCACRVPRNELRVTETEGATPRSSDAASHFLPHFFKTTLARQKSSPCHARTHYPSLTIPSHSLPHALARARV
jgi:hypothetical protein